MRYVVIGGRLSGEFELHLTGQLPVTAEKYADNMERASRLSLPEVEKGSGGRRPLAVVGGGPSIKDHLETLRKWDGEIIAINGACAWLRNRDIESTLLALDPHPIVMRWAAGAKKAILGNTCDPGVFDLLKDADVRLIRIAEDGIKGTSSAATTVPHLAAFMGYGSVTLFGCESSYVLTGTHAYQDEQRNDHMLIECDGADWLTASDFYRQARELSELIRGLSPWIKEESGGLLRAMVNDPKHRIVWLSEAFARGLEPIAKKNAIERAA